MASTSTVHAILVPVESPIPGMPTSSNRYSVLESLGDTDHAFSVEQMSIDPVCKGDPISDADHDKDADQYPKSSKIMGQSVQSNARTPMPQETSPVAQKEITRPSVSEITKKFEATSGKDTARSAHEGAKIIKTPRVEKKIQLIQ